MSARVLAVDGGQSGIRLQMSDSSRVIETHGASRLEGDVLNRVHDLVVAAVEKEFVDPVDTVVLGLSTSPPDKQEALGIASKIGQSLGAKRVIVTDDSVTHHASFFRGSPGIALAIGTGVACISVGNQKDSMFSVSGYGYLLGDDGGGFSIGRNALRLALDTQFERPDSKMVELATSRFGSITALPAQVHSRTRAVNEISQFAREVLDLAANDQEALSIVEQASLDLAKTVQRAIKAANLTPEAAELAWSGRLFAHSPLARALLENTVSSIIPGLTIRYKDSNPLAGGLWLGEVSDFGPYKQMIQAWSA